MVKYERYFYFSIALFVNNLVSPAAIAAGDSDKLIRAVETGLRPGASYDGGPAVRWTIEERMAHWNVPGVSIAVIRKDKLAWAKGYGVKKAGTNNRVDTDTVFSVGSVSKMGTVAITLRLVDHGSLSLDCNVNDYLTRWKVPENAYTAVRPVTLRGILSHTAGLTLHGFPDFLPGEDLPSVIDTLDGLPPSRTEPVRVTATPGALPIFWRRYNNTTTGHRGSVGTRFCGGGTKIRV